MGSRLSTPLWCRYPRRTRRPRTSASRNGSWLDRNRIEPNGSCAVCRVMRSDHDDYSRSCTVPSENHDATQPARLVWPWCLDSAQRTDLVIRSPVCARCIVPHGIAAVALGLERSGGLPLCRGGDTRVLSSTVRLASGPRSVSCMGQWPRRDRPHPTRPAHDYWTIPPRLSSLLRACGRPGGGISAVVVLGWTSRRASGWTFLDISN